MSFVRKLEAILFADIEGFTAMMETNELLALKLKDKFLDRLEELIKLPAGRIVQYNGDGVLCSFDSAVEAVKAAISLQLSMTADPAVPLRIGIHAGDVMDDGTRIYGDSVNIASRIESFAQKGSILVSARVYDDIKNHPEIQAVSLGFYSLKNVNTSMQLYAISNPGLQVPDPVSLEGKGQKKQKDCMLVLPFINMSRDPEQEYFSDGLTEELITALTRLDGIRVISRTTSMLYKKNEKDIKTIALETGAGYIVEGSVRTNGSNLRITAQLIDALNDVHLWADNFKGTMDDIFDIQENVAGKIVEQFRAKLSIRDRSWMRKRYTANAEAYRLYLKGRHYWKQRTPAGLEMAISYFRRAIEVDANYALAWAGLADSYSLKSDFGNFSRDDSQPRIMEAIRKALEIDAQLAEAHISLAVTLMLGDWDWANAERSFLKGIALDPSYATGHHWYSEYLLYNGRIAESFKEISLAVELDPLSAGILRDKGIFFYYSRQYNESIETALKTLELEPGFTPAIRLLSLCYTALGQFEKAIEENDRWAKLIDNPVKSNVALAYIYAAQGRTTEALQLIDGLSNGELTSNDNRGMAVIYAALADNDNTFKWLDKSIQEHESSLCSLNVDPKLDLVRNDVRFKEILKKIGLGNTV